MASLVNLCAQCDIKNKKFILGSGCANSKKHQSLSCHNTPGISAFKYSQQMNNFEISVKEGKHNKNE